MKRMSVTNVDVQERIYALRGHVERLDDCISEMKRGVAMCELLVHFKEITDRMEEIRTELYDLYEPRSLK